MRILPTGIKEDLTMKCPVCRNPDLEEKSIRDRYAGWITFYYYCPVCESEFNANEVKDVLETNQTGG
jgi:transposase-like protein